MSSSKLSCDSIFKIENKDEVNITSIDVTDDNRLLLCKNLSTMLLVYSDRGEYQQNCKLSSVPWGISIIPNEDKAVVTLPVKKDIEFVNIQSMMRTGVKHTLPESCRGITVVGDKICVGGCEKMYILSKQGKPTTTITVKDLERISYLHPGLQEDNVYVTDNNEDKVICVKLTGKGSFTCTHENIKGPKAVTTDKEGNLYVDCRDSNNIHRLSPEGNIDIIMNINQPCGLAFSNNYCYLFVANDDGKAVSRFLA